MERMRYGECRINKTRIRLIEVGSEQKGRFKRTGLYLNSDDLNDAGVINITCEEKNNAKG